MDDPVAIALILSGSSAVVALALIGRRLLNERAEHTPEAADGDVFESRISVNAPREPAAPAADATAHAVAEDVFASRVSPEPASDPDLAAREAPAHPGDDVFAARISADAPPPEPAPRVSTPAEAEVFAARVRPEAPSDEPQTPTVEATPAAPAPAPGEDVFAARINPSAPVEESPVAGAPADEPPAEKPAATTADEQPAAPAAGGDVFDSRIAPAAAAQAPGAPDPFSRFVQDEGDVEGDASANSVYPEDTCRAFAQGLKDEVLDRALTLFWALAREGSIDSNDLGALLGARSRQAGALVSTPMKRRAEEMDLPLPYVIGRSSPSRLRTWSDQFGIAERMASALLDEQQARDTMTDDAPEGLAGLTAWLTQQSDAEATLSLEEIDALGPEGLPEHACSERNWWANRSGGPGHGHAEAWLSAGRLAYPDLKNGTVTFEVLSGLQDADVAGAAEASDEAELTR